MDKIVYQRYLMKEVVQRLILFAKTFGININNWDPRGTSKTPSLIRLFQDNKEVGYIEETPNTSIYPFVLYSPIGKIKGVFNGNNSTINYRVDLHGADKINLIQGVHKLQKTSIIGSYTPNLILEAYKDNESIYRLKSGSSHFALENHPSKERILIDETRYTSVDFDHFNGSIYGGVRQSFAGQEERFMKNTLITYTFPNNRKAGFYLDDFDERNGFFQRPFLDSVAIDIIIGLLNKYDPRFFEFEEDIRALMTISDVSLYENAIRATFPSKCSEVVTEKLTGVSFPEDETGSSPLMLQLNRNTTKAMHKERRR